MQILSSISKCMVAVMMITATAVYAESAPVYDADSMQQQFESDQGQDLPPPPPPGQEGAFVPNQLPAAAVPPASIDQRLRKMEQQISNLQNNDNAARMESLQNQIQSLRSQLDQITHQLQQVQTQQKTISSDIDRRLQMNNSKASTNPSSSLVTDDADISNQKAAKPVVKSFVPASDTAVADVSNENSTTSTTPTPAVNVKSPVADDPNVAEEQQIYQTAYNYIKAKKYNDAVDELQKMLQKYPSGQFASNAHYWLGELYGLMGKNDQALKEFSTVVQNYPESPRISDAQLKVGLIFASQSKWAEAKNTFKKVINRYPGTASARLASEQLKQIKQAGH